MESKKSETIYVDLEGITNESVKLKNVYDEYLSYINDFKRKMNTLEKDWDGKGSDAAMSAYEKVKDELDIQQLTLHQFSESLGKIVAQGYIDVEHVNTSLADAFK